MQHFFKILMSPMAFTIGFLWPLLIQSLIVLTDLTVGWQPMILAAVIVLPFGVMAELRGSWIWIK